MTWHRPCGYPRWTLLDQHYFIWMYMQVAPALTPLGIAAPIKNCMRHAVHCQPHTVCLAQVWFCHNALLSSHDGVTKETQKDSFRDLCCKTRMISANSITSFWMSNLMNYTGSLEMEHLALKMKGALIVSLMYNARTLMKTDSGNLLVLEFSG